MRPINLLPPEEAQRSANRRRRVGLLMLLLAYIGLLVIGFFFFQGRAAMKEQERDDQLAVNADLRAQISALGAAEALVDEYDGRSDQVRNALGVDVAWGRLLNDLGRVIPDRVWLESLTANASVQEGQPGFGSIQMTGVAFDYPDAASWLRTLDSDQWPAIGAGWVLSTTSEEIVEGVGAVNFSSVGTLTGDALSSRVDDRIPAVPQ